MKANAPRSDQVLKTIRLFGHNRHPLSHVHYGNYCLISGNSKISSTLSNRRVKMSRGSTWSKEDIWVRYPIDIASPLCSVLSHDKFSPDGPTKARKRMLENTHKNAGAFNTFRVRMREGEGVRPVRRSVAAFTWTLLIRLDF